MNRTAALECLLFVTAEPLQLAEAARALECTLEEAGEAAEALKAELTKRRSGLQILSIAGGWQLGTRPEYAETVGRLLARGARKLSRAALETLAIVAYRQPITQPEIEAIRGVQVDGVLDTLMDRGLIREQGRKITAGRPILYATTPEFLHYFALKGLDELPPLDP